MAGARRKAIRKQVAPPLRVRERASIKKLLRQRDGVLCIYCRIPLLFSTARWRPGELPCSRAATVEHLVPRSRGGTNDIENLALACYRCNTIKSSLRYLDVADRLVASGHYDGSWDVQRALAKMETVTETEPPPTPVVAQPDPVCALHGAGCRLAAYWRAHGKPVAAS